MTSSLPSSSSSSSTSPNPPTYYDILGLRRDCSSDDIRAAYKALAIRWHPDKNVSDREVAETRFKWVSEAYQVLRHAPLRERYDHQLQVQQQVQQQPRSCHAQQPAGQQDVWCQHGPHRRFHLRTTIRISGIDDLLFSAPQPTTEAGEEFVPQSPRELFRRFFADTAQGQRELQKVESVLAESGIPVPRLFRKDGDTSARATGRGTSSASTVTSTTPPEGEGGRSGTDEVRVKVRARYGSSFGSQGSGADVQWGSWSTWQSLDNDEDSPASRCYGPPPCQGGGVSAGKRYFLQEMQKFREKQQRQQHKPLLSPKALCWSPASSSLSPTGAKSASCRERALEEYRNLKLQWQRTLELREATAERSEVTLQYQASLQALTQDALRGYATPQQQQQQPFPNTGDAPM